MKTKRKLAFTVILDGRNRELKYCWPGTDVQAAIAGLKRHGKKPVRTIIKRK